MGSGSGGSAISIHAPHTGRDAKGGGHKARPPHFNPRAPYGARPGRTRSEGGTDHISIHAPHTGRDRRLRGVHYRPLDFNPRAPYGARPDRTGHARQRLTDFNPRAPCGARQNSEKDIQHRNIISIHAPHAGRDGPHLYMGLWKPFQSTRPIRGATRRCLTGSVPGLFQSTRPIRGATWPAAGRTGDGWHFNPRAPYGARRGKRIQDRANEPISIHAPHTGRDYSCIIIILVRQRFQSTRPIRGATSWAILLFACRDISIHAPHTGRDR